MRRILLSTLFALAALLLFASFQAVDAHSGCCSWHGGVCGCGCCDGTALSSTCAPYYPECNSNASTTSNQASTPTDTDTPAPTYTPTKQITYIPHFTKTPTPKPSPTATTEPTNTPTQTPPIKAAPISETLPQQESLWTRLLSFFHLIFH